MGTSSLYHRACGLLFQRSVTSPGIQICDFNNIKIVCAGNFVLVLKWHYKYYSTRSLKGPCLSCSAWLPASKACGVFEIWYRQWLGPPSSCLHQSEQGDRNGKQTSEDKTVNGMLWAKCWRVSLGPHLTAVRVMCLRRGTWRDTLGASQGTLAGFKKSWWLKWRAEIMCSSWVLRQDRGQLSSNHIFVLSVENTDVFLSLEPWPQLAHAGGWLLM